MALAQAISAPPEELDRMFKQYDQDDPNIELHFSGAELAKMSEYEKKRLRNIKRNYLVMNALGIKLSKPDFMEARVKKTVAPPREPVFTSSDSDSDVEWVPRKQRASKSAKDVVTPARAPAKMVKGSRRSVKFKPGKGKFKPPPPSKTLSDLGIHFAETSTEENISSVDDSSVTPKLKTGTFKGFSKEFCDVTLKMLNLQIKRKEKMIKMCDDPNVRVEQQEALDPIGPIPWDADTGAPSRSHTDDEFSANRYPRRKVEKTNYAEIEMPDEDEFVYCDECDQEFLGHCPLHFVHFMEDPVDIDVSMYGNDDYAEKTLNHALTVKESSIQGAGRGIWSKQFIPKYTVFGPYDGLLTKLESRAKESGYAWLIYKNDRPHHYIDARDKGHSNWMRWVNCASYEEQQNLLAFQYKGNIYYRAIKDIGDNSELLVWYGNDYAKELGILVQHAKNLTEAASENALLPLQFQSQPQSREGVWQCGICGSCFTKEWYHAVHCKTKHGMPVPIHLLRQHQESSTSKQQRQMQAVPPPHSPIGKKQPSAYKLSLNQTYDHNDLLEDCKPPLDNSILEENYSTNCELNDQQFQCRFCAKQLRTHWDCLVHQKTHTREKSLQCKHSEAQIYQISHCKTNEITHTGVNPYQCPYCDTRFNESRSCKRHERTHTGEKPYQCQYCDARFNRSSNCKTHERTHTGEKSYQCQYCDARFNQSRNCKRHERTHTGVKPYQCQYCDARFNRSRNCQVHERTHTGEKPYQCQYCDARFNESRNCKNHERTHTGEKPYQCQYCDARFNQSNNCKNHERTHTGEKSYQCQYCDARFNQSRSCKTHERTHTGEKPYQCQFCDARFNYSHNCKTHERTHTGEKSYQCQYCDARFNESSSCKTHERTHTCEKPYKCRYCEQCFHGSSLRSAHERRKHAEEKAGSRV